MQLPWVSRTVFDAMTEFYKEQSHGFRDLYLQERKSSADLTAELLAMRKNGFEIVDTRIIEQPPTVDEADAQAAAKAEREG